MPNVIPTADQPGPGDASGHGGDLQLSGQLNNLQGGIYDIQHRIHALTRQVTNFHNFLTRDPPVAPKVESPHALLPRHESAPRGNEKESSQARQIALVADNDSLKRELDLMQTKLRRAENELQAAESQAEQLAAENDKFRGIILGQANTEKISDQEMIQRFVKIRSDIQRLVRNTAYFAIETNVLLSSEEAKDANMVGFYSPETWGQLHPRDRTLRIRAECYGILHRNILKSRCFGLEGIEELEDRLAPGAIEHGLKEFERLLRQRKVDQDTVADWRIATIKCVELCQWQEETSKRTAAETFAFLQPLFPPQMSGNDREALRTALENLAQEAFEIRMMMRKSKEGYMCGLVKPGAHQVQLVADCKSWVEPEAVEGGKPAEGSDEIAYTIFGALIKSTDDREIVLEKAQVVLRRKYH